MRNIAIILVITIMTLTNNSTSLFAQNAGGTFFPTTSVYSGDPTTAQFQQKISIIDAEILKLESKKEAELKLLEKSYKANMPKAPKSKKVGTKKTEVKKAYSLVDDLSETIDTVSTSTTTVEPTDNYAGIKADYDAKNEASKKAIIAKYDALIEKLNAQKVTLTELMINSKGNYVASTTNAQNAAYLYTSIKYADNISNNTVVSSTTNQQVAMMYIYNESTTCSITITSAPFNGLTLTPGQVSAICYPIPVGVYSLAYTEYRNGTSIVMPRTMNIPIAINNSKIIVKNR